MAKAKQSAQGNSPSRKSGRSSSAKDDGEASSNDWSERLDERRTALKAILDKRGEENADSDAIVREFVVAWLPFAEIEERCVAPAARQAGIDRERRSEAAVLRDYLNLALANALMQEAGKTHLELAATFFDRIGEQMTAADTGLIAAIKAAEVEPEDFDDEQFEGASVSELESDIDEALARLAPRCLVVPHSSQPRKEHSMARYQNMPDRDEYGRFVSDDDRRGGGRYSRGRDDDDRRMSRGYDDDRGQGRGGWFGDSQGHSEAARRGWENRDDYRGGRGDDGGYGRSGSRGGYDEDRGYGRSSSSRGGYDDDRGYGRSYGARYGDDGRRYDHGGWYGDPQGHSEAARLGWQHRQSDDRSRGQGDERSRGRYGDDDRRFSRGRNDDDDDRSRGGWFGDSEGHSEAARRGWQNRR